MPLTTPLKRPTLFSQKKYLSQKTKQKKKNKWLLENRILILTPPQDVYNKLKKFFIYKTRLNLNQSGTKLWLWYFKKKKSKQILMENIFLCLCMLCINQIFFWSSLRGSSSKNFEFWLKKITLLSFQYFGCIFLYIRPILKHQLHFTSFFACDLLTQSVEKNPSSNTSVNII